MVADDWTPTNLEAEADLLTGFPFKSAYYSDGPADTRLLRGDNVAQGYLRWEGAKRWRPAQAGDFRRYLLQREDVVLAMDRPWIEAGLKCAAVTEADLPSLLVQRVARLRGGPRLKTRFLRYLIESPDFSNYVLSIQTGTAVPHISGEQIRAFRFLRPPLKEQVAIAQILGCLDEKIESNRRMNQTLEAMARAIFKSWFVDFEPAKRRSAPLFPRSSVASSSGSLPEGWRLGELREIADVVDCLHSRKPERRTEGKPLLQLSNILESGLLDMTDTYLISLDDYELWISRMEAQQGDCVITNVGRVGAVAQVPPGFTSALGRNMTGLRCLPTFPFPTLLLESLRSPAMREEIERKTDSGTILDSLNVRNIPLLRLVIPPEPLIREFETLCRPVRERMERNLEECATLFAIREILLPKLLAGEIRVKQAEKVVKEVA
jgi:type I restriction enzyme, S subunit